MYETVCSFPITEQLKIELPSSSQGANDRKCPSSSTFRSVVDSQHHVDDVDDVEDDDCLTMVNYPMGTDDSSTMNMLESRRLLVGGHGPYARNNNNEETDDDTINYTVSGTTRLDGTSSAGVTVSGPTSFPDLSYNQFQAPLRRQSFISSRIDSAAMTNELRDDEESLNTASMLKATPTNTSRLKTRGHGTGKMKRRSHSAMLSLTDSNSIRTRHYGRSTASRPTTATAASSRRHEDVHVLSPRLRRLREDGRDDRDVGDGMPPPFRVPIDRSNTSNVDDSNGIDPTHFLKLMPSLNPRRLSLSVSSMTSDASYSRSSVPNTRSRHTVRGHAVTLDTVLPFPRSNTANTTNINTAHSFVICRSIDLSICRSVDLSICTFFRLLRSYKV